MYTEVSSFQGVGIEEYHCIQRCPHFRGWIRCIQRCPHFRGRFHVYRGGVALFQGGGEGVGIEDTMDINKKSYFQFHYNR